MRNKIKGERKIQFKGEGVKAKIGKGETENQKIIKSECALTIIEFLNCQLINFIPITKFSNRDNSFNYLEPAN